MQLKRELTAPILFFLIPIILVVVFNLFVGKIVRIQGYSMLPTYQNNAIYFMKYSRRLPSNGDVVVIQLKNSNIAEQYIIKRVIAVEGQTVQIDYNTNSIMVDGQILNEEYINYEVSDPMESQAGKNIEEYVVPDGCVFVLGDNRNYSLDSRSDEIGMIEETDILGILFARIAPGNT